MKQHVMIIERILETQNVFYLNQLTFLARPSVQSFLEGSMVICRLGNQSCSIINS